MMGRGARSGMKFSTGVSRTEPAVPDTRLAMAVDTIAEQERWAC